MPCGVFTLRELAGIPKPLVFLGAGVGITPLMSMLLDQLQHKSLKVHFCYSEPDGLINADLIRRYVPSLDADYYLCGPEGFMIAVNQELARHRVPVAQRRCEFFGPQQTLTPVYA